jgi:hypothetical protein
MWGISETLDAGRKKENVEPASRQYAQKAKAGCGIQRHPAFALSFRY